MCVDLVLIALRHLPEGRGVTRCLAGCKGSFRIVKSFFCKRETLISSIRSQPIVFEARMILQIRLLCCTVELPNHTISEKVSSLLMTALSNLSISTLDTPNFFKLS